MDKEISQELLQFIGHRLIVADYANWRIGVLCPVNGKVEPAIGVYLKYVWTFLFFYSKGSPKNLRSKSSAFGSRLLQVLKRSFTMRLKPGQLYAEGAEKETTPDSNASTETSCCRPQSGHSTVESCTAANSNAD